MKYITLLTMLATIMLSDLQAQGVGLKAGINLSTYEGNDAEEAERKTGFHVGVLYSLPLQEKLFFEPGVLFSRRGLTMQETESWEVSETMEIESNLDLDFTVDYLDIPLTLRYDIDPRIRLLASPVISFVLNDEIEAATYQCMSGRCTGTSENQPLENLRDMDFSFSIGIGARIIQNLFVDFNYQMGLLTMDEDGDEDAYNRSTVISLTYLFSKQ